MAQIRGLLRGIAYTSRSSPAAVLPVLDRALADLHVDAVATAVVAQVLPADESSLGVRRVRVSNAGHPPPVVMRRDGSVALLEPEPEPLLGVEPTTPRHDSLVELAPGDGLLLYTDGLVERRGTAIDAGLRDLLAVVAAARANGPEALCDHLLTRFDDVEDDVVLLVVQVPLVPAGRTSRPAPAY